MTEDERKLLLFVAAALLLRAEKEGDRMMETLARDYLQPFKAYTKKYAEEAMVAVLDNGELPEFNALVRRHRRDGKL